MEVKAAPCRGEAASRIGPTRSGSFPTRDAAIPRLAFYDERPMLIEAAFDCGPGGPNA